MIVPLAAGAADIGLVAAICGIVITPLMRRAVQRRFDPFEPIVLFALAYSVMFVVRPAAMIALDKRSWAGPRETLDVSPGFTEMLVLALLGAAAFVLGYEVALGRRLADRHGPPGEDPPVRRLSRAAVLVGLVGAGAFTAALLSSGGIGAFADIAAEGNTADLETGAGSMYAWFLVLVTVPATLVLVRLAAERRTPLTTAAAGLFAGLVLVQSIPFGSRIALLPFLGGLLLLLYLRRGSRPALVTLLVVAAVAFVASTFLSDLRGRTTRGESVADTVVRTASPSRLATALTTGPDSEMAPVLSAALEVIPEELGHTYGRTIFGDLVVRPVPRGLWSEKPEIPRRRLIATIWPVEHERGTVNVEFSTLVYFYWDFGVLGVVAGLFAYGVAARYLYEFFLRRAETIYGQVLFALALWFVVIGLRDSPIDTLVRAVFVLGPVWVIFAFARARLRMPARRAAAVQLHRREST